MKYDFSDQARRALNRAPRESARLGHDYVGTEHMLLGILEDPDVQRMIEDLGHKPATIRATVEASILPGKASPLPGAYPYTSLAKQALVYTLGAAGDLKSQAIAPEHIILGLLREKKGVAADVLRRHGITPERVRAFLGEEAAPRTTKFRVSINDSSDRSIYEQIVAQVTEAVATDDLTPGQRLPTVRQLADELDIAPGTVARAYSELESQGIVVTEGTKGTRIAKRASSSERVDEQRAALAGLLRPVAVAGFHLGASASDLRTALEEAMQGIFDKGDRAA